MPLNNIERKIQDNFNDKIKAGVMLYEVDVDKDHLWNLYLNSFPAGTNMIYRKRREFDCSCCRNFMKWIGGTVYIDSDYNVHSLFDLTTNSPIFQPVFDALDQYIKSCKIVGRFLSKHPVVGTPMNRSLEGNTIITYNHFSIKLPQHLIHTDRYMTIDTVKGIFNTSHDIFARAMKEITMEALDTVLELIASNTLYRGLEWKNTLEMVRKCKKKYDELPENKRDAYIWTRTNQTSQVVTHIRNHSIGTLLVDISEGMDLDRAVSRYEQIVAPANYKRPQAVYTKRMLEDAQKKIAEMGYMNALPRRYAKLDDIRVNNILFCNRDSARRIAVDIFEQMAMEAKQMPKQFSRVEEISIDKFISDVLPGATEVEAYVENHHAPNFVSLIAPQNADAKSMFKWNNNYSWAYAGNMTDSDIKENVKMAGGNVNGVLRFSIQWNDQGIWDKNDLDAHCTEKFTNHRKNEIYFGNKRSKFTRGNLDVDIINPFAGKPAVENIVYPSKINLQPGTYTFYVHCFSNRGGKSGFRAEIELNGNIYRYDYQKPLRQNEEIVVAIVTVDSNGTISIEEKLSSEMSSREIWNVKTNAFVPVSIIMHSPNYWDEQQGIGHKHYMFMLKDCVNSEKPNGFYNEFLKQELAQYKHVFEALGNKMSVADTKDQLSGLGFSATKRNELIVRVKGATQRVMKVKF